MCRTKTKILYLGEIKPQTLSYMEVKWLYKTVNKFLKVTVSAGYDPGSKKLPSSLFPL